MMTPSPAMAMGGAGGGGDVRRVRAVADFDAQVADDLTFRTGDVMTVLETFDSWLKCELHGRIGLVPETFIENIAAIPPPLSAPPAPVPRGGPPPGVSRRGMPPPIDVPFGGIGGGDALSPRNQGPPPFGGAGGSMRGPPPSQPPIAPGGSLNKAMSMRGGMLGAPPAAPPPQPAASPFVGRQVRAIAKFDGQVADDLPFKAGDVMNVLSDMGGGWLRAELNGRIGQMPSTYVVDAGAAAPGGTVRQETNWQPLTSGILFQPIAPNAVRGSDACERCKQRKVRARVKIDELTLLLCKQCFPEHDHQLLTNRGFLFLDEVELYRDAHGGSLDGLLVATYDPKSCSIVYREPAALVINAEGGDVVELSDADEHWRWSDDACAFGSSDDAVASTERARALSICATPTHELYLRSTTSRGFAKRSVQETVSDAQLTSVRMLSLARGGVAASGVVASELRALAPQDELLAPLLELLGHCLASADCEAAFVVERLARLRLSDTGAVRQLASPDAALPAWMWQLDMRSLRCVVDGVDAACGERRDAVHNRLLWADGVQLRDELMRVLLHAGFSARFSLDRASTTMRWRIEFSDDDVCGEPEFRMACGGGKRAHADVIDVHRNIAVRTWCFDMDDGFVVVRRAHRVAASQQLRGAGDSKWVVLKASRATIQGNCTLQAQEMDQIAEQAKRVAAPTIGKSKDTGTGKFPFTLRPPPTSVLKPYEMVASSPGDAVAWVEAIRASINGGSVDPQTDQPWRTGHLLKKGQRRWFALDVKGQALYWFSKESSLNKDERGLVKGFKNLAPLAVYRFVDIVDVNVPEAPMAVDRAVSKRGGTISSPPAAEISGERMTSESDQPVIVQVLCNGERKKIPLHPKQTVAEAIVMMSPKFKFTNCDGFQLCMGVEATVLKPDAVLWRYKLAFDDELELRPPNRGNGTVRAPPNDLALALKKQWGLASLGPGFRTNEDRVTGLRTQAEELHGYISKARKSIEGLTTIMGNLGNQGPVAAEIQDTESAQQQLQAILSSVENEIRSLGGTPPEFTYATSVRTMAPRGMTQISQRGPPGGYPPPGPPQQMPPMAGAPPAFNEAAMPPPLSPGRPIPGADNGFGGAGAEMTNSPPAFMAQPPPMRAAPTVKPLPKLPPVPRGPPAAPVGAPAPAPAPAAPVPRPLSPPPARTMMPPPGRREAPARLPVPPSAPQPQQQAPPSRADMMRKVSAAAMQRPLPDVAASPPPSGMSEEERRLAEREARLAAQEAALAAQEAELAAERERLKQIRRAQQRLTMTVEAALLDDEMEAGMAEMQQQQHQQQQQQQQQQPQLPPAMLPPMPMLEKPICIALVEEGYTKEEEREMSIVAGEELFVVRKNDANGWWLAEKVANRAQRGWVPRNYLAQETRPC
jgi:hypothetical protein